MRWRPSGRRASRRTRQPHRRRLAALLEPRAIPLDLRAVETTVASADVRERDTGRCERRICDTPPSSRSIRVRTGGVEPPQPWATRLQRAELAGARRPHAQPPMRKNGGGRSDRTDTAGITTPDACRYITAAKREMEGGLRLPATGGRDVTVRWPRSQLLYLSADLPASLRRRHPLTRRPWRLIGASYTLGPRSAQPLFRHFLGPPVDGVDPPAWRIAPGGIRTHGLELMRLARTAAPLPRVALSRERRSGRQDSNLRSPTPEVGGVANLPYDQ